MFKYRLEDISKEDIDHLLEKGNSYGESWCKRGGVGAFMMLARKWDRIENQSKKEGWDIFEAIKKNSGKEGVLDDIGDLRRYLLLVEEYITRIQEDK